MTTRTPLPRIDRALITLGALALALWADMLFSVGWTFAGCTPVPGTNYGVGEAMYGLPFPYMQWSLVSSMEFDWIPWILALNLALLTALAWPLVRWAHRRLRHPAWGWVGLVMLIPGYSLPLLLHSITLVHTTERFRGGEFELSLTDLRPAALYFGRGSYECTPSPFWFAQSRT